MRARAAGHGEQEQRWTEVSLGLPGVDPAFRLRVTREGLGAGVAKVLGGQDLEVGHPAFDGAFRVQASDAVRARGALGLEAQRAVAALQPFDELRLDSAGPGGRRVAVLRLVRAGVIVDPGAVRAALASLADLAASLEAAAPRAAPSG